MNAWKVGVISTCLAVAVGSPAFAQTPSSSALFVDGAIAADSDQTAYFNGSTRGWAGRGAVAVRLASHNGIRFEVDVPTWRVLDTESSAPVYCAPQSCVFGSGLVPARTTSHTAVRTVSYAFLYARHLPAIGRVELALVGGGSVEERDSQASGTFDELGPDGKVARQSRYDDDRVKYWPAGVVGVDAQMSLTAHLAVTPQLRFHTFPYPAVSILRPGIALRWRF
jgi:hypothetical protein